MKFNNPNNLFFDREFKVSVLIIDDEESSRKSAKFLCQSNFEGIDESDLNIETADSIDEGLFKAASCSYHIIILDRHLGHNSKGEVIDGIDFIEEIKSYQPFSEIIMFTSSEEPQQIVRAMNLGASNYLLKKSDPETIEYKNRILKNALSNAKIRLRSARSQKEEKVKEPDYVSKSPAMKRLDLRLQALAESNRPVLILGETGLGKGATAKLLNKYRNEHLETTERPFFNINIAAMTDNLAQSELFGHEGRSFTGAGDKAKPGFFELAAGGDLFLDEIGDASLELQTKLLKVVEEREFQRLGGTKTLKTNARVIFATNKNIKKLVEEGKFKHDLYARISTFEIELPELKDRKEDIPYIVKSLCKRANKENKSRKIVFDSIPESLMNHFMRDNIPGNIRGIENDIQKIFLFSPKGKDGVVKLNGWEKIINNKVRSRSTSGIGPIRMKDLFNRKTDFVDDNEFKGLKHLHELIDELCIQEALQKFSTQAECARALKINEAKVSIIARKIKKGDRIRL